MRFTIFFVLVFLFATQSWASSAQSRQQFCSQKLQPGYFNQLAYEPQHHMAFGNTGGIHNKGVCWWHALYQRAALYLTVYRPELPRPTYEQARVLVRRIAVGEQIVEIPGYSNFYQFSKAWQPFIQDMLEEWQMVDGFLKFAWIEGLKGNHIIPPTDLAKEMELIYNATQNESDIQWIMLQIQGISSHGVLSVEVIRHPAGAQMEVMDNNFVGQIKAFIYLKGAGTLQTLYGNVAPYLGRQKDLRKFKKAADSYCTFAAQSLDYQSGVVDNGFE